MTYFPNFDEADVAFIGLRDHFDSTRGWLPGSDLYKQACLHLVRYADEATTELLDRYRSTYFFHEMTSQMSRQQLNKELAISLVEGNETMSVSCSGTVIYVSKRASSPTPKVIPLGSRPPLTMMKNGLALDAISPRELVAATVGFHCLTRFLTESFSRNLLPK